MLVGAGTDDNASVALKYLGTWLTAERRSNDTTFAGVVAAYRQRLRVAREVFPRASLAV